jgi:hypothetical protein
LHPVSDKTSINDLLLTAHELLQQQQQQQQQVRFNFKNVIGVNQTKNSIGACVLCHSRH